MKNRSTNTEPIRLTKVLPGEFLCARIELQGIEADRIQRLGLCEGRPVVVLSVGDPMILMVSGSRIGISRQVANSVLVVES